MQDQSSQTAAKGWDSLPFGKVFHGGQAADGCYYWVRPAER